MLYSNYFHSPLSTEDTVGEKYLVYKGYDITCNDYAEYFKKFSCMPASCI